MVPLNTAVEPAFTETGRPRYLGKYTYTNCPCPCTVEITPNYLVFCDPDGSSDGTPLCAWFKIGWCPTWFVCNWYCPVLCDITEEAWGARRGNYPRDFLLEGGHCMKAVSPTTIVDCGLFTATRDPSEVVGGPKVVPQQMDRETAMVEQPDGSVQLGSVVP